MYRGNNPRIFPIIVIILVVALVIAAVVSLSRMLLTRSDTDERTSTQTTTLLSEVLNTGSDRSTKLTVRGPIVADEEFRSYQITISPESREYTVYRGYLDTVIRTKKLDNNHAAYEQFVYALDKAEISKVRKSNADDDLRGVCATGGLAYKFEALAGDEVKNSVWTSTCPKSQGTMAADVNKIHALFANQIPESEFEPLFNEYQ